MSTPGFLEIQLNPDIAYGTKGGLSYTSVVVTNQTRVETRFQQQSRGFWKFNLGYNTKSKKVMAGIQAFFQQVQGKTYGWRFRNYREYYTSITDYIDATSPPTPVKEPITTYASGTTMQLIHTRRPGTSTAEIVPIRKPDMTVPIKLYRDGSGTEWPNTNYTLDTTTGIVTFNTSQTGHTFSWLGYWDTPCRFDVDSPDISWDDFDIFSWSGINIMEIVT